MGIILTLVTRKELRDGKRYKQREIAAQTGISEAMISRLLRDQIHVDDISLGTARAIANWLECTIDDLYADPVAIRTNI